MGYDRASVAVSFEPEILLPTQLLASGRIGASVMGEKRLLVAVLEEAVATFQRYVANSGRRGQRLFREAEAWIQADDPSWPCSFRNICDVLGFDAEYLRGGLFSWRDERWSLAGAGSTPFRSPFRRLSGSRTRAIGRPIGLGDRLPRDWRVSG